MAATRRPKGQDLSGWLALAEAHGYSLQDLKDRLSFTRDYLRELDRGRRALGEPQAFLREVGSLSPDLHQALRAYMTPEGCLQAAQDARARQGPLWVELHQTEQKIRDLRQQLASWEGPEASAADPQLARVKVARIQRDLSPLRAQAIELHAQLNRLEEQALRLEARVGRLLAS